MATKRKASSDKETLWAKLQRIQKEELEALTKERESLEEEKQKMLSFDVDDGEIIDINVGGELIIQANRGTLCQVEGSLFSSIFSGRWEGSVQRDSQNRIFLDHDPEMLRIIINFLRLKRIEDPSEPLVPPQPPKGKGQAFRCLLAYFGLGSLFCQSPPNFLKNFQVHEPNGSCVTVTETATATGSGHLLTCDHDGILESHFFCLGTPVVDGDCWKITIEFLNPSGLLFLGLIRNMSASNSSFADPESYGWAWNRLVSIRGTINQGHGGWNSFRQGDVLYFRLYQGKIYMFSSNVGKMYSIDCTSTTTDPLYFHCNFCMPGTSIVIESLDSSERNAAGWK